MTNPSARLARGLTDPESNRLHKSLSLSGESPLMYPMIGADLIAYLERVFPNKIDPTWTLESFREACGYRRVVDHLIELYRSSNKSHNVFLSGRP